jgi:putative CocE/NonD family hydrolase
MEAGTAASFAHMLGADVMPFWKVMLEHPAYDGFWQSQALDKLILQRRLTVPTMWEQGLWDQEDMWGANHSYRALRTKGTDDRLNHIVMGPWFHSQVNREGRSIGPLTWAMDTTEYWRDQILLPFFNQYLRPGSADADTPNALVYDTGLDRWDRLKTFPQSCEKDCPEKPKPLYLAAGGRLSFTAPAADEAKFDEYVSDPAHPVPYLPRPVTEKGWRTWLLTDQRFVDGRPDVETYVSEPLTEPMKLSGEPMVHLVASTSGTDSDWVVKIIDVQPEQVPPTEMSGYELPLATDIFRGRYRVSFEHAQAIEADKPLEYSFALPNINHTFLPGHRIMVQVQSTLFPLYDRNPQRFVPNILEAKPADFQKATQRIWHTPGEASYINLPVVKAER